MTKLAESSSLGQSAQNEPHCIVENHKQIAFNSNSEKKKPLNIRKNMYILIKNTLSYLFVVYSNTLK